MLQDPSKELDHRVGREFFGWDTSVRLLSFHPTIEHDDAWHILKELQRRGFTVRTTIHPKKRLDPLYKAYADVTVTEPDQAGCHNQVAASSCPTLELALSDIALQIGAKQPTELKPAALAVAQKEP